MTSHDIVKLLQEKHASDFFIDECKTGPSQAAAHLRLDGWAMTKSWSKPCVSGYEIKISRSDFNQDSKWQFYLPYCNLFWFVCPRNLIKPEELPSDIGLLWVAGTGTRLLVKKKAAYRDVAIPEDMYRYILMCRVKVHRSYYNEQTKLDYWRSWLAEKEETRKLGYEVKQKLREHVDKVEAENLRLKKLMENYGEIRDIIAKLGLNPDFVDAWAAERRIKAVNQLIPDELVYSVGHLRDECERVLKHVKAAKGLEEGR